MTDEHPHHAAKHHHDGSTHALYDVAVVGGGTAGVVAAVQAGRAGARTLLVEKTGMLGGTITMAGVNFPGLFHAWGRQVIAGIGWELVNDCVLETRGHLPDFGAAAPSHAGHQVRVDRAVFAALCDEAMLGAGVELLLHAMPAVVCRAENLWRLQLATKTGLIPVCARELVDGTGDANGAALAGCALRVHPVVQPATLVCHASGYDPSRLDMDAINRAFAGEVERGQLLVTDAGWNVEQPDVRRWLLKGGENANHIVGINAVDSQGKTRLETEARRAFLRLYRFLRSQPGLDHLRIDYLAPECGVRETVTIAGRATITVDDYVTGRRWEDAVCHSFYPIDLHGTGGRGVWMQSIAPGVVPSIPRGAMLPADAEHLVVAGRCLSSDRLANSALRVQATAMATGQAAGALAALAAAQGVEPGSVPMEDLRKLLRHHGAIVPDPAAAAAP